MDKITKRDVDHAMVQLVDRIGEGFVYNRGERGYRLTYKGCNIGPRVPIKTVILMLDAMNEALSLKAQVDFDARTEAMAMAHPCIK